MLLLLNNVWFILLLNQFSIAICFITRLPCIIHAKFNIVQDLYMQGTILKSLTNVKHTDCAVVCISNPICELVNFKKDATVCELITNSQTQGTFNDSWNVLATDTTSNQIIGQICEQVNPCPSSKLCRDVCDSSGKHTFSCLASYDVSRSAIPSISSSWDSASTGANKAIDGDLNSVAITGEVAGGHWFKLDLSFVYQLTKIVVYNRLVYFPGRMVGNKLIVSETENSVDYREIATLTIDSMQTFDGSYIGRYVLITKNAAADDLLQVAEINVYV